MPDDRVKISALDSASTMETGDMFPVTQERNGVKKTNKAFMSQIASEVVNGIEYTTALDTDDKKPIGAINELLDRLIALLPVVSFSSTPIATITDGAENVPMKSLIVDIVPKQASGTPTPSSPLPITGVDEVEIIHSGKNMLEVTATSGRSGGVDFIVNSDGSVTANISAERTGNAWFPIASGINIKSGSILSGGKNSDIFIQIINSQGTLLYKNGNTEATITEDLTNVTVRLGVYSGIFSQTYTFLPMIRASGDSTWEPYNSQSETKTIALGQTVYGGEVDVVSGQGKETLGIVDMGSLNWTYSSVYKWFYTYTLDILSGSLNILSPIYEVKPVAELSGDLTINNAISVNGTSVVVRNLDYTDANTFKTAMSGIMLVYPLATPTPITTTPTTIKTQGGTESIFADCGDVSGEYRADIQKYIDGLVNNGGNRSLNSLNLSKGAIEEKPEKEEVKEEEPKEEEKK